MPNFITDLCFVTPVQGEKGKIEFQRVLKFSIQHSSCTRHVTTRLRLCGFRYISTSGLGVGGASRVSFIAVFTARRNARIASAVLAMAFPSVCPSVRPSVRLSIRHTPVLCQKFKTTARSTVQFTLSYSKRCLVL